MLDPEFVVKMLRSLYIDDLVSGGKNKEEMKGLYDHASKRLAVGGFTLKKWHTNDKQLKQFIDEREANDKHEQNKSVKEFDSYAKKILDTKSNVKGHKVFGLEWDCDKDILQFDLKKLAITASRLCPMKRNILSIYLTSGIVSPITVAIKALFQELCTQKVGWDDEINESQIERWDTWVKDLAEVKSLAFRGVCTYYNIQGNVFASYLHGFCEASNLAYCAVIYFVYDQKQVRMLIC